MDLIIWLLLAAYVIYDWTTTGTWWLPWIFAVLTVFYAVWFYGKFCHSWALHYLQQLINRLRDKNVAPARGRDEAAEVFTECALSPTGRTLMLWFSSPGPEPGNVQYGDEAMSILTAFVQEKQAMGYGAELDANTLRWLETARQSFWKRLYASFLIIIQGFMEEVRGKNGK